MEEGLKNIIYEEEYERERARDDYKVAKNIKSAMASRRSSYLQDFIILCAVIYSVYLIREFGFDINIKNICDSQFLMAMTAIVMTFFVGFIFFPKSKGGK